MALVNEIQRITVRGAGSGGIRLTIKFPASLPNPDATTALIPYNATTQVVVDALNAAASGGGGYLAPVDEESGPLNTEPIDVEFLGDFAGHNFPQMEIDASELVMEDN